VSESERMGRRYTLHPMCATSARPGKRGMHIRSNEDTECIQRHVDRHHGKHGGDAVGRSEVSGG